MNELKPTRRMGSASRTAGSASTAQLASGPEPAAVRRDQIAPAARGPGPHSHNKTTAITVKRRHPEMQLQAHATLDTQETPALCGPTARPPRKMNGHSLPLVLGTRLSPLLAGLGPPPARPRPRPGGSAPASPNSARTMSSPVTRTSRRTGDSPPTPQHVLASGARRDVAVHSNPTFTGCGRTNRRLRRLGYAYQGKTRQGCQRTGGPGTPAGYILGCDHRPPTTGPSGP